MASITLQSLRHHQRLPSESAQQDLIQSDHEPISSNSIFNRSISTSLHSPNSTDLQQQWDDVSPNPDFEWVLFDPNPTQSFTSMPTHDGRGQFSPDLDLDSDFEDLQPTRSMARSLTVSDLNLSIPETQLFPVNWDDDEVEEDVLSIPSSLSLGSPRSQSRSQRERTSDTHSVRSNYAPAASPIDSDDEALFTNPHAISAGLSTARRSTKSTISDRALSIHSASLPDGRGRACGRRMSDNYSTRSHSNRTGRGSHSIAPRSLSRKPQPLLPELHSAGPIRTERVALRFLARVANRIMALDSDTMTMVADVDLPQSRTRRISVDRHNQNTNERVKFSIGDGDAGLVNGNELSSPLDLSRFSAWAGEGSEIQEHIHEDDENENGQHHHHHHHRHHHHWSRVLSDWTNW
ncbi:uncharacterized protein MELLADRAFT_73025 [Melampsora larici-populina 98AG31]|uniref:Uncharacterized protein n=1 Tax=Melampsora larici-populina (strain 98AG31 / pathotype 3-4-7) TaxID=747676 RepID=F4S227_MELLP|nr:uncharacterized protein MELLADRAFT_73025 [Melampsora larici-populina 98AG31]EGG01335.1 hypothetical protein MELLADRAFT_73025 [Melampsora larici-populina 98AG31]